METDCIGFAVHILPNNVFEKINVLSVKMKTPYNGLMTTIKVTGNEEQF